MGGQELTATQRGSDYHLILVQVSTKSKTKLRCGYSLMELDSTKCKDSVYGSQYMVQGPLQSDLNVIGQEEMQKTDEKDVDLTVDYRASVWKALLEDYSAAHDLYQGGR